MCSLPFADCLCFLTTYSRLNALSLGLCSQIPELLGLFLLHSGGVSILFKPSFINPTNIWSVLGSYCQVHFKVPEILQ